MSHILIKSTVIIIFNLSDVCIDEYDFILKQESFKNELAFVSSALGVNIRIDPKYEDSPSTDFIQKEFLQMPRRLVEELYNIYYADFVLFNYTVDEFIASNDDFLSNEFRSAGKNFIKTRFQKYENEGQVSKCLKAN